MELTVIAAVVLGGTRVTGGMGTLTGHDRSAWR